MLCLVSKNVWNVRKNINMCSSKRNIIQENILKNILDNMSTWQLPAHMIIDCYYVLFLRFKNIF